MFKISSSPLLLGAVVAPLLVLGCAAAPPTQSTLGPPLPDPGEKSEYQVDFPDPGRGVARYIHIALDQELSKSCGLMRTYFEFDSAALSSQDRATLRAVADCLDTPLLRGEQISIVGRADARGPHSYNTDLGLRRAKAVKDLLVEAGVAEERITLSTLGSGGAVGGSRDQDAYSHGYDRRVDVLFLTLSHAPR